MLPEGNIGGVSSLIRQGVESLTLPETVTNILNIDSVRTESMREITVDSGNPVYSSYGGVLYNKEGTEILYIPFGLETLELKITGVIEKNALYGLKNLKVLKFTEGTTELQGWAVENCENLEKVYIPESVKHIDSQAFAGCGTGFIIYAPEGSSGAAFAEENGIETKVPSEPEPDEKETEPGETETEPDETEPKPGETETKPGETESGKTEPTPGENGTSQTGQKTEEPGAVSETVKLKKVTKLKVTYKANKKIVLSWKKVQEADGYEIYRLQGKRWVRIKRTVKKVRVTIAKGSARKYRYKVRAYKKSKRGTLYGAFSKKLRVKKK